MPSIDKLGRRIAGLLTHSPGPGIYSRLERALQQMPANVRTQELPGLIRRYKDGVPGWELREVDLPGLVGDSAVVPRQDLLDRVRERSPVYTHKEVVLGGRPVLGSPLFDVPEYQNASSKLGQGVSHGVPRYSDYGQGGQNYAELLLLQPGQVGMDPERPGLGFGSHWAGQSGAPSADRAVAHARFDTHGDALRINELQSDLGIHNRKAREFDAAVEAADRAGNENELMFLSTQEQPAGYPFPLEDAWADILIKRLALEAARGGHRAIEIASPRAIADKVGGNIDNYEHFYGKVVPGALERLGRKMGGLTEDAALSGRSVRPEKPPMDYSELAEDIENFYGPSDEAHQLLRSLQPPGPMPPFDADPGAAFNRLAWSDGPGAVERRGTMLRGLLEENFMRAGMSREEAASASGMHMPRLVRLAEEQRAMYDAQSRLLELGEAQWRARDRPATHQPGRRYIMSDEMRRRLIEQGVGASLMAPMLMQDGD